MRPRFMNVRGQIGQKTKYLLAVFALAFALFGVAPQLASAQTHGFDGFKITKGGSVRGKVTTGWVKFGSGWYWKVYAEIQDKQSDDLFVRIYYKLDRPRISNTNWIFLVQAGSDNGIKQHDSDDGHDPTNGIWVKLCLYAHGSESCNTPKYIKNE